MAVACRAGLVVAGGVLVHLTLGTFYTFGNLSPYMTSYLRNHTADTDLTYGESVWINALSGMGQGTTMYFGGVMERRLGPRLTVLFGAWFQSLGILLTYFSIQHSFAATMITYGLMFGFGIGVAYAVPMAVAMRWLPRRKGLVNGFIVAGFGGGAFIFDQIQTAYVNPHNKSPDQSLDGEKFFTQPDILDKVPTLFLILGCCYSVMQLIGALLLTNPPDAEQESIKETSSDHPAVQEDSMSIDANASGSSIDSLIAKKYIDENDIVVTPKELFKIRGFYILWLIFLFNGQGVNFISPLYKAYGETFIDDDVFLAGVGAFAAVCNATGRILWGSLADRFSFKVAMLCLCTMFTVLMLTLGLSSLGGRWMFLIWVGLLFLAFSGNFSLMPTATACSFGQAHYAKNYGLLFTSQVITSPIAAVLTASLRSAIGWYGMFYLIAAFSFVSFLLTLAFNVKKPDGRDV